MSFRPAGSTISSKPMRNRYILLGDLVRGGVGFVEEARGRQERRAVEDARVAVELVSSALGRQGDGGTASKSSPWRRNTCSNMR